MKIETYGTYETKLNHIRLTMKSRPVGFDNMDQMTFQMSPEEARTLIQILSEKLNEPAK